MKSICSGSGCVQSQTLLSASLGRSSGKCWIGASIRMGLTTSLAHGEPDGVSGLPDIGDQLFRLLSSLTHGETEDLVIGCSNGFEAWRRIHRRWDPLTAGRKRNILRAILNPERVKRWENVRAAIEQLEDLFRRYENRKNEAGERERLSEDINATSLELLVPSDIERHLFLNKGRLTTYAQMKSEIDLVIESSLGSKAPISRPGAASSSDSGPAPMDVDSLTKVINSLVKGRGSGEKGKSKGKGKDAKVKTRAVAEKVQLPRT